MKSKVIGLALLGLVFPAGRLQVRQSVVAAEPVSQKTVRIGQIFIVGNTRTRQDILLRQLPFFPGEIITIDALETAARNLAALTSFKGKPKVTILEPEKDTAYHDVLVEVVEKRSNGFGFACLEYLEACTEDTQVKDALVAVEYLQASSLFAACYLDGLELTLDCIGNALGVLMDRQ